MLWCKGARNIGLSNHKLKPVLTCTVWSQYMPVGPRQTCRQTSWPQHDNSF